MLRPVFGTTSKFGMKTVGASSSMTKDGTFPGWFISLVATVITRLQSGESVCDVVGLVATVSIAG